MNTPLNKVLVIGPAWIGDMMMAQSLFALLRAQHGSNLQLDVLAPDWTRPLLERMPEVSKALSLPFTHGQLQLAKRYQFGKQLRVENYQRAFVLPNSWKSAIIPWAAGIKKRTGWLGEMRWGLLNDARQLDKQQLPQLVQRYSQLATDPATRIETLVSPKLICDPTSQQQAFEQFHLTKDKPILALCPGAAYGPAKQWPQNYYAEVAQAKLAAGWQVWLFGSDSDKALTAAINHACSDACVDLAGKTSLAQAIDLLGLATAVVSNDSGLMHITSGLQLPQIAIYGSSDPAYTPPMNAAAKIVQEPQPCSPCFDRECRFGHTQCLTAIKPQRVLALLEAL